MKSMALYGKRKAFYDTKTTCFAVAEAIGYQSPSRRTESVSTSIPMKELPLLFSAFGLVASSFAI